MKQAIVVGVIAVLALGACSSPDRTVMFDCQSTRDQCNEGNNALLVAELRRAQRVCGHAWIERRADYSVAVLGTECG